MEQKSSCTVKIVCICCAEQAPANFVKCHCPLHDCILKTENPIEKGLQDTSMQKVLLELGLPEAIGIILQLRKSVSDPKKDERCKEVKKSHQISPRKLELKRSKK